MNAQHIPVIIERHAEDAAFLWLLRDSAINAPHYSLKDLAGLDDRVDANIDGLRVAGEAGWDSCKSALETGEPGEVFVAAVSAFESADGNRIDTVAQVAQMTAENFRALVSAVGWLDYTIVAPLVSSLLSANSSLYRRIGIAAMAIHRQNSGAALLQAVESDDPMLVVRALKAAGELGRSDLLPVLKQHWQSGDEDSRFWSAWSSVLLGDSEAIKPLMVFVNFNTRFSELALQLAVRAMEPASAQNWLKGLWQEGTHTREVLQGAGISGDTLYIPTLIKYMSEPALARVAGEAFSLITGVDLAYQDLEGEWPAGFEAGPTEAPEDEDVDLDQDEDLPWPDQVLVQQWWDSNKTGFQQGTRYLLGKPVTPEHCAHALRAGFQRQRVAAALELAMSSPGTGLFETRAPGFRQQRLLAQE